MAVVLDFEGGVAGDAIATSATIQEVVGAQYTATAQHGSLAMEAVGNAEYIRANFTHGVEHSGSMYFRSSSVATSRTRIVNFTTSGNVNVCVIGLHSDGKIDLSDTARQVASSVSWVPNTWHRVDWQYVQASKTLTVRIFLTAEATLHSDEISFSFAAAPTGPSKWTIGALSSGAGSTVQLDTLQAVSGLSWIGPYGTPPPPSAGTVTHHWVGAQTTGGFKVISKTSATTSVRLVTGTDSGVTQNLQYFGPTTADGNGYTGLTATGLTPGAAYYYQLEDTPSGGSATRIGAIGKAKTLPSGQASFTFDFGNCTTNANLGMEAYDEILADDPQFFVHLGDFHYRNSTSTDAAVHRANFEQQIADVSGLKTIIQNIPTYYMRSDHDAGGGDNADPGSYYIANQAATKQVVPLILANQPTDALYYSFVAGRVRFIIMDLRNMYRTFSATAQSPSKTMLGSVQKQWLKDRLSDPEPVKIMFSDAPWLGVAANSTDKWWSYDNERTEIGDYITSNNIRALLVTGDLHSIYADDGTNNQWGDFPIIGSGALGNIGGFAGGPYQQLWNPGAVQGRNYGKCVITDSGTQISLAFTGRDALNNVNRVSMTTTWTGISASAGNWTEWNGSAEIPLTLEGVWNGTSVDPVELDEIT